MKISKDFYSPHVASPKKAKHSVLLKGSSSRCLGEILIVAMTWE